MTASLTKRQQDLLNLVQAGERNGEPPMSLPAACEALGVRSRGSLHKQVSALVEAGHLEPLGGKQRGLRSRSAATEPDLNDTGESLTLPLLGKIAAGAPIEAVLSSENIAVPRALAGNGNSYILKIKGESMRDVGILDGDLVIIERTETARRGQIVVALIDQFEATLKRYEPSGSEVLLHAENAEFPTQRYTANRVAIQGVLVGQMRRYN
jgi:repressor LexA